MENSLARCLALAVSFYNLEVSAANPECHDGVYSVYKGVNDDGSVGNLKEIGLVEFTCTRNVQGDELKVKIREHLKYLHFELISCRTEKWKNGKIISYTSHTSDDWDGFLDLGVVDFAASLFDRDRDSCSPYKDLQKEILIKAQCSDKGLSVTRLRNGHWIEVAPSSGTCSVGTDSFPANLWNPLLNPSHSEWDGQVRAIDQISGEPRCWSPSGNDEFNSEISFSDTNICVDDECEITEKAQRFDLQSAGDGGKQLRSVWYDKSGRWLKMTGGLCGGATVILKCTTTLKKECPGPKDLKCPGASEVRLKSD